LALNAEPTKARMAEIVHGVGRPRLNLSEIKAIVLPLPPIEEQRRIVSEAERRLSIIDELEMQVDADQKRSERLRQGILKRAFEGKLVPQDPNDEPANVLLERIRGTANLGCAPGKQK
jgi:type I restriction enzyme S subunit